MSIPRRPDGTYVPIREAREATGSISAVNGEVVLPLSGDESALVTVVSAAFIGTLEFTGVADGTGAAYHPVLAYPYPPGCVGGTIPPGGQPLLTEALVAANTLRTYSVPCGQLKALRVRASAYTSGVADITIRSDSTDPLSPAITARASTLLVTATAAAGTAVTVTLPAVPGLRHIVDFIQITRSATAALTASATPTLITTTNLPGAPVITMGSDAGGIGVDKEARLDFGSTGLAATAVGTATTVVCPATPSVVWRATVSYRLGL